MRASFHHLSPPPALLVSFIALVTAAYAHGDHEDMAMAPATLGEMASSMVNATATAVADSSYFQQHEHSGLIIGHIALMTITWVFVLPIGIAPLAHISRLLADPFQVLCSRFPTRGITSLHNSSSSS